MKNLKWREEYVKVLQNAMAKRKNIGYATAFVALDANIGVKLFPEKDWRDYALDKQKNCTFT